MKCDKCGYDDNGTGDTAHVCGTVISTTAMPQYAIAPAFSMPNSFVFSINNGANELLRLDADGFHYMGKTIDDAGEAYRLFMKWLETAQVEKERNHA